MILILMDILTREQIEDTILKYNLTIFLPIIIIISVYYKIYL